MLLINGWPSGSHPVEYCRYKRALFWVCLLIYPPFRDVALSCFARMQAV
jgi:hypothetical protein